MKNLPEDELFNSVENRLRNYSELPDDDVWNKISGAIPSGNQPSWAIWINRTAATLSLILLFALFYGENTFEGNVVKTSGNNVEEKKARLSQPSNNPVSDSASPGEVDKSEHTDVNTANYSSHNTKHVHANTSESRNSNIVLSETGKHNITDDDATTTSSALNGSINIGVDEIFQADSLIVDKVELKSDSTETVGHVLPPAKRRKKSKLTFYSMVSPSLSFQHATPDSEDGVVVDKLNSPGVISSERFGISFETGLQGQISNRFQYIVGVLYYHQSQQISYEEKSDGAVIESGDDLNYDIKPSTVTRSFDYSMRNVGVHAGILYTLKQRGLMHKAGVVVQYQIGLMRANEGDVYDNSSSDYLNYQLLYRVEYTFRSGVGLFVQPAYTQSIIANESLDAPFKLKQSRASLGIGIVYRF